MKPLFIPLKSEHYEAFDRGEKEAEMRVYGPRWNEKTCTPGREVIISKGYGKKNRRRGKITAFHKFDARGYDAKAQADVLACYGTLEKPIAHISITLAPRPVIYSEETIDLFERNRHGNETTAAAR